MSPMPASTHPPELHDFTCADFTASGLTRPVWWTRDDAAPSEAPVVLVCHEVPGPTPAFLGFLRHLRAEGFRVVTPHLVGELGRPLDPGHLAGTLGRLCIAREFRLLAADAESPIASWLRALATEAGTRWGVTRLGAVGLCLTGNFALGLLLNPLVVRAVAGQPALPLPLTPRLARGLHLTPVDTATIAARLADPDDPAAALALRFTGDPLCPRARFEALGEAFPTGLTRIELDAALRNPHGHRRLAHATLTVDLDPTPGSPTANARDRVVAFLRDGLAPIAP
jgi:dienelactone hydrolase